MLICFHLFLSVLLISCRLVLVAIIGRSMSKQSTSIQIILTIHHFQILLSDFILSFHCHTPSCNFCHQFLFLILSFTMKLKQCSSICMYSLTFQKYCCFQSTHQIKLNDYPCHHLVVQHCQEDELFSLYWCWILEAIN